MNNHKRLFCLMLSGKNKLLMTNEVRNISIVVAANGVLQAKGNGSRDAQCGQEIR